MNNFMMNKKIFRKIVSLLNKIIWSGVLLMILLVIFPLIIEQFAIQKNKKEKLFVSFFDVGQGDASFIRSSKGKIILIDGGPDNLILYRLGEQMAFYERKIEAIIISHWHDDHIIGLLEVLRRYQVRYLILAANLENSLFTPLLFEEAAKNKTKVISISSSLKLNLNNQCELFFLNPLSLEVKENSNNSLLTKLNCLNFRVLFSGDNEKEVENALLQSSFDLSADIFKASHHGSKTSNQEEFLKAVNPKIMVISVGINNRFNHPAPETLKIAEKLKIEVFRTDESGNLVFSANIN